MKKSYTIHDLPLEDRPRERLQKVGVDNLSLQELLALIIEKGKPGYNVMTVAQNLLAHFGNLERIKEASLEELQKVKGVGFATACKLKAAFKIGERALQGNNKRYGAVIEGPEDVFNLLRSKIGNKEKEYFVLLSLNSRHQLISVDKISVGTLDVGLAHPREIFKASLANNAASIIIAHNHPSGDVMPSSEDIQITRRAVEAGNLMGITVFDHVIISKNGYTSIRRENSKLFKQ